VKRALASALLLLFSIPLALPLFAATEDAAAPACCRREGKHHCAMAAPSAGGLEVRDAKSTCPLYSKSTAVPSEFKVAPVSGSVSIHRQTASVEAFSTPSEPFLCSAWSASVRERAPPVPFV
jgi:hypothetical protein